jgi:hypothetical protein
MLVHACAHLCDEFGALGRGQKGELGERGKMRKGKDRGANGNVLQNDES